MLDLLLHAIFVSDVNATPGSGQRCEAAGVGVISVTFNIKATFDKTQTFHIKLKISDPQRRIQVVPVELIMRVQTRYACKVHLFTYG